MPCRDGMGPPWLAGRIRGCGCKLTPGREGIMSILSVAKEHLSADDIHIKLRKDYPGIGLATVYRTLELLVKRNLVYKFDFGDGRARYEIISDEKGKNHHHHLVCKKCSRVIDYNDFIDKEVELLQKTEKGLSQKYNFKITDHLIQFYGLCDKCK